MPTGEPAPVALDATLRAAAPHQLGRKEAGDDSVNILPQDIRHKVLSRLTGASVLFTVDASGSMSSEQVMSHAKGVVLSLLTDVYQKRDRVGMIAFRGTEAKVALPFTTSVELAQKRLKGLPTGGKSPVALALAKSLEEIQREVKKNPGRVPFLIILTDGRANISMEGGDPFGEALRQAKRVRGSGVKTLVVDTDLTWIDSYPWARILAEEMGAKCLRLKDLKSEKVLDFISG
ncbi:VWA domain-containing protein [bacterium]|nr:MAG: VWA domain-containing protein [bacterium]